MSEEDLIQKVNAFIKRRMKGNAFSIDLEACRLLEQLKEEITRLREQKK